jgi:hypothetical protein
MHPDHILIAFPFQKSCPFFAVMIKTDISVKLRDMEEMAMLALSGRIFSGSLKVECLNTLNDEAHSLHYSPGLLFNRLDLVE